MHYCMKIGFIAWGMAQMNIVTQDCKLRSDSAGFEVRGLFFAGGGGVLLLLLSAHHFLCFSLFVPIF